MDVARKDWDQRGTAKMTIDEWPLSYCPVTGNFYWIADGLGRFHRSGMLAGSRHSGGYVRIKINQKTYFAHRLAWLFMTGKWPENDVDHINGVRHDNRAENLREATAQQNRWNSAGVPARRKYSSYKGVSRDKNKWRAQIFHNGSYMRLGNFDSEVDAAAAYEDAAKKLRGEYAKW